MNAAQQLAAMRKMVWHDCAGCGTRFKGIKKARYCDRSCQSREYYKRKKAKKAEAAKP